jgi:hypothetical protein
MHRAVSASQVMPDDVDTLAQTIAAALTKTHRNHAAGTVFAQTGHWRIIGGRRIS